MTDFVVDYPAFNIVPQFAAPDGPDASTWSNPDDTSIDMVGDSQPVAIGNYGNGTGAPGVYVGTPPTFFPEPIPDGYAVTSLRYVVRAAQTGAVAATSTDTFWIPGPPSFSSWLWLDQSSDSDGLVIDVPDDTLTERLSEEVGIPGDLDTFEPRVRVWWAQNVGGGSNPITVSYVALRAVWSPTDVPPPTGTSDPVRRRFYPRWPK
jgi:hypothetical protein